MVDAMRKEFADMNLTFSIGGQISFDLFPTVSLTLLYLDNTALDNEIFAGGSICAIGRETSCVHGAPTKECKWIATPATVFFPAVCQDDPIK